MAQEIKFKYAYRCQGSGNWEQIALEMSDGSTIFIDTYNGRLYKPSCYWKDAEGKIHHD